MGSILRQALICVSATGRKNVRLKNKTRHFSASHFSVRIVIVILLCCAPTTWSAQRPKADLKPPIPDVEVLDQEGKRIHFYSDLIKGKVVVISFLFTSCKFYCPMQGDSLSKVQSLLGERLGRDINLITVSLDPENDTPERLKAWGAIFGAKPGWTFVTGAKPEIDKISMALTGAEALKGEHSPVVYIGNDKTGIWIRAYGLHDPEKFNKLIEEAIDNSPTEPGQKGGRFQQ
jgi:protein SCO1